MPLCFGPMCHINPAVTGPANIITLDVMGSRVRSIILDVTGSAPVITPAEFTMYINYVSLHRIAVCLQFILPLIEENGNTLWQDSMDKEMDNNSIDSEFK